MMLAVVTFRVPGMHRWPEPSEARAYLGHTHRHLFHVRVELGVRHDEREVEYHDLLALARRAFLRLGTLAEDVIDFGGQSCETLARRLAHTLRERYDPMRALTVEVLEDGEVGARFTL